MENPRILSKNFKMDNRMSMDLESYCLRTGKTIGTAVYDFVAKGLYPRNIELREVLDKFSNSKGVKGLEDSLVKLLRWLARDDIVQRKIQNIAIVDFILEKLSIKEDIEDADIYLVNNLKYIQVFLEKIKKTVEIVNPEKIDTFNMQLHYLKTDIDRLENREPVNAKVIVSWIKASWDFVFEFPATYKVLCECVGYLEPFRNFEQEEAFREMLCTIDKFFDEEDTQKEYIGYWQSQVELIKRIQKEIDG